MYSNNIRKSKPVRTLKEEVLTETETSSYFASKKHKRDGSAASNSLPATKSKPAQDNDATVGKHTRETSQTSETVEEIPKPPSKRPKISEAKSKTKSPPKNTRKQQEQPLENEVENILDSIPTVELPTTVATGKFIPGKNPNAGPPPAAGSKEIPSGEENCLAGLSFVFTGILQSIEREEAANLVKRYGGRVMSAPSSKTSFVVLGENAGPKKIETIKKNKLKTIDEDGLFQLIRTLPANGGSGEAAQKAAAKREEEEKKIIQAAKEMEEQEKMREQEAKRKEQLSNSQLNTKVQKGKNNSSGVETKETPQYQRTKHVSAMWTDKYAPQAIKDICGNKSLVEKMQKWLRNFQSNLAQQFKKPGPDGSGIYRAVMLSGPPGVGKTTAAHLVAKLEGYDKLEFNASDTRSEKLLKDSLKGVVDSTSINGYFAADGQTVKESEKRVVLIMDEVDGMSAGDRGGVGALTAMIRKTKIPIICICNDRKDQKMRPFDRVVLDLAFRRPDATAIRSRLMSIAYREGLKITPAVIDQLVAGTHADIRQIINLLSTYRLSKTQLDFDESQKLTKMAEKDMVLKPWDIAGKYLSGVLFNPNSKATLNDKIELYFDDPEFSYLMVQENYLKTRPARAQNAGSKKAVDYETLKLFEAASESISDGDLVDAMIHGSQQHWSLMPVHAVFSCVKPSSYIYGSVTGRYNFTSWLGQNSKTTKLMKYLQDIQAHMRLRISGSKAEVRQSYMPILFDRLGRKLQTGGAKAIPEVIAFMDEYYLTKEDWDAIFELSVAPNNGTELLSKIPKAAKSSFTRK